MPFATQVESRPHFLSLLWLGATCLLASAGCGSLSAQRKNADGVRQFDQAQYQKAIHLFHEAIDKAPKDADGYYNLASSYHRLGTLNRDEPQMEQAEQYYRMCHDRDPNHQSCYRGLAVLLIDRDRRWEAFRLLEEWAEREPTLAAPRIELARLHREYDDMDMAKRCLLDALAVDHENARALAALGQLREQSGESIQALADYQRSLWYNRFQPEVAARIASLKAVSNPNEMLTDPSTETHWDGSGPTVVR